VSVEDNGVGIAAKHLPNIFNRFYRADASRSQVHGHGLGLALAKTIVQRQKGTITATSTLGKGSVFEITLPLA
jgi:signal transduction histidine kinase